MVSEKQINQFAEVAVMQSVGTKCYLYEDGTYSFGNQGNGKPVQFKICRRSRQTAVNIAYMLMNWEPWTE